MGAQAIALFATEVAPAGRYTEAAKKPEPAQGLERKGRSGFSCGQSLHAAALAAAPVVKGRVELFQCDDVLPGSLLDENQQQLRSRQCIGACIVALHDCQPKVFYPVIHARLTHAVIRVEQRCQLGQIKERVLERVAEKVSQLPLQQTLVEVGMKGHQRAVTDKIEEIQQGCFWPDAGSQLAGRDLVNQYTFINLYLVTLSVRSNCSPM